MYFKFTKRNPYRDLIRNASKINKAALTDNEKDEEYRSLYRLIKHRLLETEQYLNRTPAFASRCEYWGQTANVTSIAPMTNSKNPWLAFKQAYEESLTKSADIAQTINKELGWFYHAQHRDDWLAE